MKKIILIFFSALIFTFIIYFLMPMHKTDTSEIITGGVSGKLSMYEIIGNTTTSVNATPTSGLWTMASVCNGGSATWDNNTYKFNLSVTSFPFGCKLSFTKQVVVTYNANGGSVSEANATIPSNQPYGQLPTPTRSSYIFKGWYTQASAGTQITSTSSLASTENHSIYAQWQVQVTLNPNGGSTDPTSKVLDTDSTYGTLPTPVRSGYTFKGWYTSSTGGSLVTSSTSLPNSGNHTIYAQWQVKVTLNANGGTVTPTSLLATLGSTYGTLPTPTRTNYVFKGWFTTSTGGTQMTSSSQLYTQAAHTLYAHWEEAAKSIYLKVLENNPNVVVRNVNDRSNPFVTSNNGNTIYECNTNTENTCSAGSGCKTYYFAGAVTNNYVKFGKWASDWYTVTTQPAEGNASVAFATSCTASSTVTCEKHASAADDMYWRIVRVNEDNSLRLIYSGTSATSTDGFIGLGPYNNSYSNYWDAYYTSSTASTIVTNWYNANFVNNTYKDTSSNTFSTYLSKTATFCSDSSYNSASPYLFAGFNRLVYSTAKFVCSSGKFTGSSYPIALLSADESAFAGNKPLNVEAATYLKDNNANSKNWWTSTPSDFYNQQYARVFDQSIFYRITLTGAYYRPVTSLKSCVKWKSGNGTSTSPYEVFIPSECVSANN